MSSEILLFLSGAVHQLFEPCPAPYGGSQVSMNMFWLIWGIITVINEDYFATYTPLSPNHASSEVQSQATMGIHWVDAAGENWESP